MKRSNISLAGLAILACALPCAPAAWASQKRCTSIAGFSCADIDHEIMRRERLLLRHDPNKVRAIVRELAKGPDEYKKLAGEYLGFYVSVRRYVREDGPRVVALNKLREAHEKLRDEARQAHVLVPPQVASQIRDGKAFSAKGVKLYGVPQEAMTFDSKKLQKATEIKKRQWKLLDKIDLARKRYAEAYGGKFTNAVNKRLIALHQQLYGYRKTNDALREQLEDMFRSGDFEHCLGTPASAPFARFRSPTWRVTVSDLLGLSPRLPYGSRLQFPSQLYPPEPVKPFEVLHDGKWLIRLKLDDLSHATAAEQRLLTLDRWHGLLKLYDTVRSFGDTFAKPFKDSFGDPDKSFGEALGSSLYGVGKGLTWDAVKGTFESAGRLLDRASKFAGPNKAIQKLIAAARDDAKALAASQATQAAFPDRSRFPSTTKGALKYIEAVQKYRQNIANEREALAAVNKRIDQNIQDLSDALAVYAAGKGAFKAAKGFKARIKASIESRQSKFLEYKKRVGKAVELQEKVNAVKADPVLARQNPQVIKLAEKIREAEATAENLGKKTLQVDQEFRSFARKKASSPPNRTRAQEAFKNLKTLEKNLEKYNESKHIPDESGATVEIGTERIELRDRLGGGSFGQVYKTGNGTALKIITDRDAWIREVTANASLEKAKLPLAETRRCGVLKDKRFYIEKTLIPKECLLDEIVKNPKLGMEGALPVEYQTAVLELAEKVGEKGFFAGDISVKNVYVERLPDGSLKAGLLEGDFTKKMENMTGSELLDQQLSQMTEVDRNVLKPVGGGTLGHFKYLLDPDLVEQFKNRHRARAEAANARAKVDRMRNALSDELGDQGRGRHGGSAPGGLGQGEPQGGGPGGQGGQGGSQGQAAHPPQDLATPEQQVANQLKVNTDDYVLTDLTDDLRGVDSGLSGMKTEVVPGPKK